MIASAVTLAGDTRNPVIEADHLEAALAVGEYLEASVAEVFANFGTSSGKTLETRVLDFLRSKRVPIPEREVYRALNISAKELDTTVQPLARLGLIQIKSIVGGNERSVRTFEAVSSRDFVSFTLLGAFLHNGATSQGWGRRKNKRFQPFCLGRGDAAR